MTSSNSSSTAPFIWSVADLLRVFRDLDMVEQMGSRIARILQVYPKMIYRFTNNFIRITLPYTAGFIESQATPQADKVLLFCEQPKRRSEIQAHLGLKEREHFRKSILNPLIIRRQFTWPVRDN